MMDELDDLEDECADQIMQEIYGEVGLSAECAAPVMARPAQACAAQAEDLDLDLEARLNLLMDDSD